MYSICLPNFPCLTTYVRFYLCETDLKLVWPSFLMHEYRTEESHTYGMKKSTSIYYVSEKKFLKKTMVTESQESRATREGQHYYPG